MVACDPWFQSSRKTLLAPGPTPVSVRRLPKICASPVRTPTISWTPGTLLIGSSTLIGMGE